jgi:hypothetical protein
MLVKHAQLANHLLTAHADSQDQLVDVTKNTTHKPTNVTNADSDHSLETESVDNKTLDAEFLHKLATREAKSNLINPNAMLVQLVLEDKDLLEMFAKHQDQFVIASKNMTN